jgi:hypothetical protein
MNSLQHLLPLLIIVLLSPITSLLLLKTLFMLLFVKLALPIIPLKSLRTLFIKMFILPLNQLMTPFELLKTLFPFPRYIIVT